MKCPACNEAMLILEFDDVEIDHCAACGGVWLDRGELELMAGEAARPEALAEIAKGRRSKRRCPRCNARMREGAFPGTRVDLDACPRGHGLWFDKGELETVLQTGGAGGAAARMSEYFGSVFGSQ
ncbi:MAG: zf-TFIIB domain-containing protein [Kiritimatiellae bacterium]|nr:zf-TFIIB domain-containing protein [Kiritimatiellia bacterium]